jgi:hypothetical protein
MRKHCRLTRDEKPFTGDVATARGFLVNRGQQCETAGVDETNYWETRDKARLLGQVSSRDGRVGGIPRAIVKVVGLGHCTEAPSAGQPPFSRLETNAWEDEQDWDDLLGDPL